ncbi:MAG: SMC-Scp complex subunit ScpB [bacterium]
MQKRLPTTVDLNPGQAKGAIESLLFVADEPLALKQIVQVLEIKEEEAKTLLDELRMDYENGNRGIQLREVANGYQISTRPEFTPWIQKLKGLPQRIKFSRSALEVLSIIAYQQPVTRAEIESIRGIGGAGPLIKNLLKTNLIQIAGRSEAPGRPVMYKTTQAFLKHFGLTDLSQLPKRVDSRQ